MQKKLEESTQTGPDLIQIVGILNAIFSLFRSVFRFLCRIEGHLRPSQVEASDYVH